MVEFSEGICRLPIKDLGVILELAEVEVNPRDRAVLVRDAYGSIRKQIRQTIRNSVAGGSFEPPEHVEVAIEHADIVLKGLRSVIVPEDASETSLENQLSVIIQDYDSEYEIYRREKIVNLTC